jgi:hypothetical protein
MLCPAPTIPSCRAVFFPIRYALAGCQRTPLRAAQVCVWANGAYRSKHRQLCSGAECLPALFPCWDVFLAGPWEGGGFILLIPLLHNMQVYSRWAPLCSPHGQKMCCGSERRQKPSYPSSILSLSLCAFRPYVCVAPLPVVRWCVGKALVIPDHCQARIS